ncbi:unnamed protein product [Rangifer tarandus platyrhynchus]|uniref:Uncharacterized protein n=1 Tax=Rangifer tarandus platyrhynchus TaxID=3082113 RepID=A0ABN8ZL78_RANTA|nr:unnamed protein product [Rangifer tarandus platyrhynchus]
MMPGGRATGLTSCWQDGMVAQPLMTSKNLLFRMTVPVTHGHFGPGGEVFCTCGLLEAVQESLEDGVIPGLSLPSNTQPGDSRMRAWVRGVGAEMVGAARDRPRLGRDPGDTCTGGPRPSGSECSGTAPEPRHSPPALPPSCPQISGLGRQMPRAGPGGTAGQKAASVHERKSTSS